MRFPQMFKPRVRRSRKAGAALTEGPLLSKLARIPTYREAMPDFDAEVTRARRYQRPLSVLVMRCVNGNNGSNGSSGEHIDPSYPQMISLLLGAILPDTIRETDLVAYDAANRRYVILMPELTAFQAERAVRRLNELLRARVSTPTSVGVAEFPRDGLTLEEVVASAVVDSHGSPKMAASVSKGAQS